MTLEEILFLSAPFVPAGFLLGAIPMLAGLGVQAITNIFRKA